MSQQDLINQLRKAMPKSIAEDIVGVQPMDPAGIFAPYVPRPDTWQSYLRRLGNGINGLSERSKTITEADIVANAEKYMQIRYPGPYRVEPYYNSEKMKFDLRLRFDDPREETMWLLRWS